MALRLAAGSIDQPGGVLFIGLGRVISPGDDNSKGATNKAANTSTAGSSRNFCKALIDQRSFTGRALLATLISSLPFLERVFNNISGLILQAKNERDKLENAYS
jgi:hypothetical protein